MPPSGSPPAGESDAFFPDKVSRISVWWLSVVLLAGALAWGMDGLQITPEEQALRSENEALRRQLQAVSVRMDDLSERVALLSRMDEDIYRTLLQVEPLPADVRRVGVGGVDGTAAFDRFPARTSLLLRRTASELDELEREVMLQTASTRDLYRRALRHRARLAELPALLPANGAVVSGFGLREHPILGVVRPHHGIDVVVPVGTPVVASGDGIVRRRGTSPSYGRFVEVVHPRAGYTTFYAHLSAVSPALWPGASVRRGEVIAYSGDTGRSTGPHLHFEVRDSLGRAVDPIQFFAPTLTPERFAQMKEAAASATASLD